MKDQRVDAHENLCVRPLELRDLADALQMFPGAMMHLHPGPEGAGAVRSFFQEIACGRQNAWVAEAADRLIGLAVLSIESRMLARLTYLHVAGSGPHHLVAAKALAEIAIRSAWDGGFLKLVVHTRIPASPVIEYMHQLGFEFARSYSWGSQRVVEFYRNLYEPPRAPSSGVQDIQ